MNDLAATLARLLVRELEGFGRELELFPDEESVWRTIPGVTNSAGNLALHVAGNLQYYVGAVLGGTGYVRDREDELGRRSGLRTDVIREIRAAIRVVDEVLRDFPAERLAREYPERVNDLALRTDRFLLHLCTHAAFHLGQAGYLRRALTAENRSSGTIPLRAMAG
jgi:uncharacterized damage-inducible protein DinB